MPDTIVFAHKKETLPEKTLMTGKPQIAEKLARRGIKTVLTLGGEAAFYEDVFEAHEFDDDHHSSPVGKRALADVGLVINRLDRPMLHEDMPDQWHDAFIPVANENELRKLAGDKQRSYEELFEPLGLGIPSRLIRTAVDAAVLMELYPASRYISKPNSGTFGRGIVNLSASEVLTFFADSSLLGKMILQPAYDFTLPLDPSIKPYDRRAREDYEMWSKSSVRKEFRMYGFYSPGVTEVFAIGRALGDERDSWFFADQETVPQELFDTTKLVVDRAARHTHSAYVALDIAYGRQEPDHEPGYHIVELNGRMPYLVGYNRHVQVADKVRDLYADSITRVIDESRKL